ncbi:MAG: HD domain-containing protein [Cytophagales bacterium]|nr:CCA tRNA nucleotidyltransferase [Bernardetiaceae bacterium]MDW8205307.1 HD domain-containing protein [Cytophagales bacterium]
MNFAELLRQNPVLMQVAEAVQALKVPGYIVGGYVRDLLLGRKHKPDIDFVCVGSGIRWAECVAQRLQESTGQPVGLVVYKNFGTAMIQTSEITLEFVGARKESYRADSRKPIVEDGTLQDDQLRRDFTINAMAISLNQADFGNLIDPFNGQGDLKRKIIKTPLDPNITFSDDPLRMMRAIRFATQLNFDIEPDTFQAIIHNKERLAIVSMERITDELNKIILADVPSYGFKLLFASGLLHQFFPEMVALHGVETVNGHSHKDNFYHTLQVLDNVCAYSNDLWLRWAAILHDIAKPATKRYYPKQGWTFHGHEEKGARMVPHIFKRLKLPTNEKMKFVQKLVRLHLRPIALVKETVTDSAIRRLLFEAGDDIDSLMKLCRADITSKDGTKVKKYLQNFDRVEQKIAEVEARDHIRNFQPVITGEIIMETFNLPPSKAVGDIKVQVREAILDGKIRNFFPEAYEFMLTVGQSLGYQPVKILHQS